MKKSASTIFLAVTRARAAILSVALAYVISVAIGLMLAHTGNVLALAHRNRIVGIAQTNDVSAMANNRGQPVRAALLDWSGNLRGAAVDSVLGMGVVFIYPMVAYRGWVGGIVSVEHDGTSRLRRPLAAAYLLPDLNPATDRLLAGGRSRRQPGHVHVPAQAVLPGAQVAADLSAGGRPGRAPNLRAGRPRARHCVFLGVFESMESLKPLCTVACAPRQKDGYGAQAGYDGDAGPNVTVHPNAH